MHIRVDDLVEVLSGDDSGARGKVLKVDRTAGKVVVEGINRVYKHMKRSQKNPQGGRLSKEMPVDASNVQLVCPQCGRAARLKIEYREDGAKQRRCKRCQAVIGGPIAPPRAAHALRPGSTP